jgi:hypothetical protein
MKYITTIVRRLFRKEIPQPVGRWRLEDCNTKLNQKIDLSNEDHCGPCGEYALDKNSNVPLDAPNTDDTNIKKFLIYKLGQ